jgi:penicillin-insensitive murein endopeptidase
VGWPHHGVQTGAIELPDKGPGFVRYRSSGGHHWGQPALVEGIREAARRVASELPDSPPLVVGDLSAQFGGRITRHYSHRSGRDVDLLWFVTTLDGTPIQNSSFVPVGERGVGRIPGRGYVRLDAEREWRLIRALLTSPHVEVQWLYASNLVQRLVLEHALAAGESQELISRAETVMQQPLDGLPHNDHLHVRIACPPSSRARGCVGGGPDWSVLDASEEGELALELEPHLLDELETAELERNAELQPDGAGEHRSAAGESPAW